MDLGSTICKPVNPKCNSCPLLKYCLAHKNNTYKSIPLKTKKLNKVIKKGYLYIGITTEEKIILIKRPKKDYLVVLYVPLQVIGHKMNFQLQSHRSKEIGKF